VEEIDRFVLDVWCLNEVDVSQQDQTVKLGHPVEPQSLGTRVSANRASRCYPSTFHRILYAIGHVVNKFRI
jgi:hypothetical protein